MSIDGSTNNVTAIEIDMRDALRARGPRLSDVNRETNNDYSSLVSGISVRSVQRSIISLMAFKGCARS